VINHVKDVEYTDLKLETSNICTGLARRLKTSGVRARMSGLKSLTKKTSSKFKFGEGPTILEKRK
ncbi:MAG: hypothetical protein ACI9LN_001052, partial [Saprospiraceae bacterium]